MRIGVCLHDTEIRSVSVLADGTIGSHSAVIATTPSESSAMSARALEAGLEEVLTHHVSSAQEAVASVSFTIGTVLRRRSAARRIFIRVAPRSPIDTVHEHPVEVLADEEFEIVHISGGHSNTGEELVPLDTEALERWCATTPRGGQYVITSVGSLANDSHERQIGQILIHLVDPGSIQYSHSFHSSSVEVRERTAAVNSSLIDCAEEMLSTVHPVLGRLVPAARLYVTTNEGGCHPLSRLAVSPVHSLFAEASSALVGAAGLAGVRDSMIAVSTQQGTVQGQFVRGAPAVLPQFRTDLGEALATKVANLVEVDRMGGRLPESVVLVEECGTSDTSAVVVAEEDQRERARLRTSLSLCAFGAAVAPLGDWAYRIVPGTSEVEVRASLSALESRVRARLASFGAQDSRVVFLESGVEATTYDNSNTVSMRVRAIAFDPIPLASPAVLHQPPEPSGVTSVREVDGAS